MRTVALADRNVPPLLQAFVAPLFGVAVNEFGLSYGPVRLGTTDTLMNTIVNNAQLRAARGAHTAQL